MNYEPVEYTDLESVLNNAYDKSIDQRIMSRGGKFDSVNVLIQCLPSEDKTNTIFAWAKEKGINLVLISGEELQYEPGMIKDLYGKLCALDEPRSVLYIRNLHKSSRFTKNALLTPISDHVIKDEESNDRRLLKNFVLTIATTDKIENMNEDESLDLSMLDRFSCKLDL